ncbi:MAG TPA: methyl-accepting chemotaxis protein [Deltaproteobacteria bacterium]|nr:methyl-accepting chemotaxis protein [Deltaproteobacteria bacterium]
MKGYLQKIVLIYSGLFSVVHFGWIISTFYLMCNSPGQMKVFSTQGIIAWLICFAVGICILRMIVMPVSRGLEQVDRGNISGVDLMAVTRRNSLLPILVGLLLVAMTIVDNIILYINYLRLDIGPIAANGLWPMAVASGSIFYILIFGAISLVTNPMIDFLKKECARRGVEYQGMTFSLQKKLWVVFILFCVGFTFWLGMMCFYEGVYRIQEELKSNALALQQTAVAVFGRGQEDLNDEAALRSLVDTMTQSGLGSAFLSDRSGNILYNPQHREIYNNTWDDIDMTIRNGIRSGKAMSIYENIHEQVISLCPVNDTYAVGIVSGLHERMHRFNQFWAIFGLLALLGLTNVAAAGFSLFRSIIAPIRNTVNKLKDISEGEGDLSSRLLIQSSDETGLLAEQFNIFVDKLETMIKALRNVALQVNNATHEVAAGSQELSQATQEQAAAVEEVAATIEEMTSSIKQNASNAAEGRERVKSMVNMAQSTGEASRELVYRMNEISEASKKIGNIITTVNEVAFQTNLLALNAAVEAARAGEHGKGFAVVAQEVRALAQRSADAARQIKTLIEDTVDKIGAGDEMVKKSRESLDEIIDYIKGLSQSMEEIASVSEEQASGIDELNRAISQIDTTTQKNASTVEELASTSDSLSMESRELAGYVGRFKVSDEPAKIHSAAREKRNIPCRPEPVAPKGAPLSAKPVKEEDLGGFEEF